MICCACSEQPGCSNSIGISVDNWDYRKNADENMPQWFSNFKKLLRKHCENGAHLELDAVYQVKRKSLKK